MGSSRFALGWHLFLIYTANKEWKHTCVVHGVTNIWDNLPRKAMEAKINELKWPLGWGEGAKLLGEVRENGRAECPVPGVPFPLLVLWYVSLAIASSLSEAILLIEAPLEPHQSLHGRDSGGRCLGIEEACPLWHHLCWAVRAGKVKEADGD